jgi:hypothetical protein
MVFPLTSKLFCLEAIGKLGPGMRLALAQMREITQQELRKV